MKTAKGAMKATAAKKHSPLFYTAMSAILTFVLAIMSFTGYIAVIRHIPILSRQFATFVPDGRTITNQHEEIWPNPFVPWFKTADLDFNTMGYIIYDAGDLHIIERRLYGQYGLLSPDLSCSSVAGPCTKRYARGAQSYLYSARKLAGTDQTSETVQLTKSFTYIVIQRNSDQPLSENDWYNIVSSLTPKPIPHLPPAQNHMRDTTTTMP